MGNWISQTFYFKNAKNFEEVIDIMVSLGEVITFDNISPWEEKPNGIVSCFRRTKNTIPYKLYLKETKKYPHIKIRIHFSEMMLDMAGVMEIQNGEGSVIHGKMDRQGEKITNPYKNHRFNGTEEKL